MTTMVDLGHTPLANSFLREIDLQRTEPTFPLRAVVCEECWLVQLSDVVDPRLIFEEYAYFSSISETWLQHAGRYAAAMTEQLSLGPESLVLEVASNDGYLLRSFQQLGVRVLGIEPARNVAAAAMDHGVPTITEFLTTELADQLVSDGIAPQLIVANNVLAHVPDIRDFVSALGAMMTASTVLTVEFPHLLTLVRDGQFDTIYHEHYSYLSLGAVDRIFRSLGLAIFDVSHLPTHGGSIRLYATRIGNHPAPHDSVARVRREEIESGLFHSETYRSFSQRVGRIQDQFRSFLDDARSAGSVVAGYGAAAKGNTLLNSCHVGQEDILFVADRSPHKQGLYLPGSRVPVRSPSQVDETRPDYLIMLPWNLADEIIRHMGHIRAWGGQFVIPVPSTRIVP